MAKKVKNYERGKSAEKSTREHRKEKTILRCSELTGLHNAKII